MQKQHVEMGALNNNELPEAVNLLFRQIESMMQDDTNLYTEVTKFEADLLKNLLAVHVLAEERFTFAGWAQKAGKENILDWLYQRAIRRECDYQLQIAIACGQTAVAEELLRANPQLLNAKYQGMFHLHIAALARNLDMAIVLIKLTNNPDCEVEHAKFDSPFSVVVQQGDVAMAEVFLNAKANVNAPYSKGNTAVHIATRRAKNSPVLLELMQTKAKIDVNANNNVNDTPFLIAVKNNDIALIERWLGVNARNDNNTDWRVTVFQNNLLNGFKLAIQLNFKEIFDVLLPRVENISGQLSQLLNLAASRANTEMIKELCKQCLQEFIAHNTYPTTFQAQQDSSVKTAARALLEAMDNTPIDLNALKAQHNDLNFGTLGAIVATIDQHFIHSLPPIITMTTSELAPLIPAQQSSDCCSCSDSCCDCGNCSCPDNGRGELANAAACCEAGCEIGACLCNCAGAGYGNTSLCSIQ